MTIAASREGGKDLAALFDLGAVGLLSDEDLLARFCAERGQAASEAAFGAIVARHGPMVLGVCRRILGDDHASADAFQATFLILARKAPSVRVEGSLGRWLHGVGLRVARRSRAVRATERARFRPLEGIDPRSSDGATGPHDRDDLRGSIDEELARLPDRYRSAVILCYLEGLTQEQAAQRLGCPVGTVQSRLHRARERLRAGLARRGFAPERSLTILAAPIDRAELPAALASKAAAAGRILPGEATAGMVPAGVEALARHTLRGMLMTKGSMASLFLLGLVALSATAAGALAPGVAQDPKPPAATAAVPPPTAPVPVPTPAPPSSPIADRLAKILAEYRTQEGVMRLAQEEAMKSAKDEFQSQREWGRIYTKMAPDDVAFCRRMIDLALSSPQDPAARDALIWVVNKPGRNDSHDYGDEYARAAALLVRHHGDDPEAIRVGLQMNNLVSAHRDLLLTGFLASAKGREAKGLARLALGRYYQVKAGWVAALKKGDRQRSKIVYSGMIGDDGKPYDKQVDEADEAYAYRLQMRLVDPDAIKAEAERLFEEVIADYGDIPFVNTRLRELEVMLKEPTPSLNGRPMTVEELTQVKKLVSSKRTLGQVAKGHIDEMENLVVGKPAPEIDGVDFEGRPLKLSSYRGKVVVLTFWGSWCGPCMREVPHERELAERLKDRPFALLGVNCNEPKGAALKAIQSERMTWPQWHDGEDVNGPIVSRYHIRGYPTVFVIDAQGIIRANQLSGLGVDKLVDQLLGEVETTKPAGP